MRFARKPIMLHQLEAQLRAIGVVVPYGLGAEGDDEAIEIFTYDDRGVKQAFTNDEQPLVIQAFEGHVPQEELTERDRLELAVEETLDRLPLAITPKARADAQDAAFTAIGALLKVSRQSRA